MTHTSELKLKEEQCKSILKRHKSDKPKEENKANGKEHGEAHSSEAKEYGGALWDIWRRQDVPKLNEFLVNHCGEFMHSGKYPIKMVCAISSVTL